MSRKSSRGFVGTFLPILAIILFFFFAGLFAVEAQEEQSSYWACFPKKTNGSSFILATGIDDDIEIKVVTQKSVWVSLEIELVAEGSIIYDPAKNSGLWDSTTGNTRFLAESGTYNTRIHVPEANRIDVWSGFDEHTSWGACIRQYGQPTPATASATVSSTFTATPSEAPELRPTRSPTKTYPATWTHEPLPTSEWAPTLTAYAVEWTTLAKTEAAYTPTSTVVPSATPTVTNTPEYKYIPWVKQ